jgi:hypothetical protein
LVILIIRLMQLLLLHPQMQRLRLMQLLLLHPQMQRLRLMQLLMFLTYHRDDVSETRTQMPLLALSLSL